MTVEPAVIVAVIGALSAGLGAFAKMVYSDLRKDRDDWKEIAQKALNVNDKAIDVAAKKADGA